MAKEQRDKILKLSRIIYKSYRCEFPEDDLDMIEYLNESQHPTEINTLRLAIIAHNVYNNDDIEDNDFFEWHGL